MIISFSIVILATAAFFLRKDLSTVLPQEQISSKIPVSVTTVKKENLSSDLSLVGTINANNDINVLSQTQGEVKAVFVKPGSQVKAGTVLVQVDDDLKKSALATAEVNYQKAKRDLERNETLYQEKSVSSLQLDGARLEAKSAENQLGIARRQFEDTRISTRISGTVNTRNVEIGTMVSPGTPIANIVDISNLKVKVNVNEVDAFQVKAGDKVEITTDVYPTQRFQGRIDNIASKADESHSYLVEIIVPNSAQFPLKAGMFARVSFKSIASTSALVIPRMALIGSIKNAQVYIIQNQLAVLRAIVIGRQSGDLLQVLNGLNETDSVVTNGQNNVSDGASVVIIQ